MATADLKIPIQSTFDATGFNDLNSRLKELQDQGMSTQAALKQMGATLDGTKLSLPQVGKAAEETSKATRGLADSFIFAGGSFAKARAEFVTLIREMVAGGNTTRTVGALVSALNPAVAAIGVAALGSAIAITKFNEAEMKWVEATIKAQEEMRKLQQGLLETQEAFTKNRLIGAMPLTDKINALWHEVQRLKAELAAMDWTTQAEDIKKAQKELENYTTSLDKLREAQMRVIEAEIEAGAARIARTVDREETERWKAVEDEFNATLTRQTSILQSIHQQQQLINANPFIGAAEKDRMLLELYNQELIRLKKSLDELQQWRDSGLLDDRQIERTNQLIQRTRFEIQAVGLEAQKLQQPFRAS